MELNAHRRKRQTAVVNDSLQEMYPHDVNMYTEAPCNVMSLTEFEDIALERLQLFRIIEQAGAKGHRIYSEDWKSCIEEDLLRANMKKFYRLLKGSLSKATDFDFQARRVDHLSHFIMRLAYCRSEELRRWFLNRELEWFRLRFMAQGRDSIQRFFKIYNLSYNPISDDRKQEIREELASCPSGSHVDINEFYKVAFMEVASLVKNRKVFIQGGYAYVPASELVISIQSKFRACLSEALAFYSRRILLLDDDRIELLLSNLHNLHTGNTYRVREDKDSIDPACLDSYSQKHFPLCMRHMHNMLRINHHLPHFSRLSYGLFLKGIGLFYDDAMSFWKDEFCKKIDSNKFDKEYGYNIKHMYGKVGRMLSYSPYSCIKIIMTSVGPQDHHGCPFKHWDAGVIRQKMLEYGFSQEQADELKILVRSGHYQVACGKYFEYSHQKAPASGISHPNQYFEESMDLEKKGKGNKK